MAPPANKKQKTDAAAASPPSPIVFQSPGLQPDVRLVVFDQEFHVHSVVLKLYSAFFRKFLDSPDKATAAAGARHSSTALLESITPSKFKYEWVTKFDETVSGEDADTNDVISWYLVAATGASKVSLSLSCHHDCNFPCLAKESLRRCKAAQSQGERLHERVLTSIGQETTDISTFKGDKVPELRAFEKLFCAFYIKQYEIEDFNELETITRQADYYCALPMLSRSLDGALWRSEVLVYTIKAEPCRAFTLAAKLRNALLFRESLIWVLGPWGDESWKSLGDPKLKKTARHARYALSHTIEQVQEEIIFQTQNGENEAEISRLEGILRVARNHAFRDDTGEILMPYF
ncbi:hypothetical protein LARI1_G004430 [Lachnellula arida]|uniref:BTB domain-containing protein n=1 Tax=Lachnellula arida TaxID=1316785 RepID=A0A8T9BG45_9HELO|nr:hypothetical protein LARI1_G004430 [Lachnellula arida]